MSNTIIVPATRTDCHSNKAKSVLVTFGLTDRPSGLVIHIINGGVTGYESFYLKSFKRGSAWCACFGTENVWDRLEISKENMTVVIDFFDKEKDGLQNITKTL